MSEFFSLEEHITAEYGWVSAWVAKHPKLAVWLTAAVWFIIGHVV